MSVRVRYAPSPTGYQHIGGVRTALFNYLFARAKGGVFILRIEDTDRERYQKDALQDIYDTYDWLGLRWEEGPDVGGSLGPYEQSERKELYQEHAGRLLSMDRAYRCYCSAERLEKMRSEGVKGAGYDRHCRELGDGERLALEEKGAPSVVRLKIPLEGRTSFHDELLGDIERRNRDISPDPILLKSDGFPTYHLANVVDDHLMQISHIIRAQEWLPSVAIHVLIYAALGWEPPKYCHLPLILGKDGGKLSKRHGSTSVRDFRNQGYLPEALINYVARLGWSYDETRELFSLEDLESLFSIEKISKSPAVFDYKKLQWLNGVYIRSIADSDLERLLLPYFVEAGLVGSPAAAYELEVLKGFVPIAKERLRTLADAPALARFLFEDIGRPAIADLIPKKLDRRQTLDVLERVSPLLDSISGGSDDNTEQQFRALAEELGIKLGELLMPLRTALTGSKVSPPLFESMRLLGEGKVGERLKNAIEVLREPDSA